MNLDELKSAWKCQGGEDLGDLKPDELLTQLKTERKAMDRGMLFTDIVVACILISCNILLFLSACQLPIVWPLYLGSALVLGAAIYHPWQNHRRRQREKQYGASLKDELLKKRDQLVFQIHYSRWSSIWGYYLPIIAGLILTYWQNHLNGRMDIDEFCESALFHLLVLGLLGYFVGGLGIPSARKQKVEIDKELDALDYRVTDLPVPRSHRLARQGLMVTILVASGFLVAGMLGKPTRADLPIIPAPAFSQLASFDESEISQLETWMESVREAGDYPALMVAIVGSDQTLYQGAVGHADLSKQRKATPETLWHVASVTKAFTGTLAAILHEEEVVDLDAPVVDYLPDNVSISTKPDQGNTITLRQLASHTP